MPDYQIQESSLKCAKTGRELTPGEKFYSVLYDRGMTLVREDVSKEAWQGPPADAFSFWLSRAPTKEQPRRPTIDDALAFDCFERLAAETEPQKINFRYILGLSLMRKKRLKFEGVREENGREIWSLTCAKTRKKHSVVNPQLTEEQLAEVQEEARRIFDF